MGRHKTQSESDEAPGAPEWMVTFSDCMTLLLTFFVLLLSFSSFDEGVFRKLKVIFANSLDSASVVTAGKKDAFLPAAQFEDTEELDKGSEKPTLKKGIEDNLSQETEPTDFRNRKVFLVPSDKVFWGKGTAISGQGRRTLAIVAAFLKEVPNRVVISENTWGDKENSNQSGLERAWAVMEYLTATQGIDKKQLSISAASTVAAQWHGLPARENTAKMAVPQSDESPQDAYRRKRSEAKSKRMLEIVLLERSIYN